MNANYLGLSPLTWVIIWLVGVAGTWLTVRIYRTLISMKDADELFITETEMRQMRQHVRDVDFWSKALGFASLALLAAVVVVFALGGRV